MDTTWFAVDRDGHVAVFDSGEAGVVPVEGYDADDESSILDELVKAAGGPALDEDDEDDAWENRPQRLADLGIYYYTHEEWENALAGPYDRRGAPETPLPGHKVPHGLLAKMASFDGRFAETPRLQPAEHWPSDGWSDAWVSTDGTSVHCVPGHETEYAKHFADLQEACGDQQLTLDPPSKAPPARRWCRRGAGGNSGRNKLLVSESTPATTQRVTRRHSAPVPGHATAWYTVTRCRLRGRSRSLPASGFSI
jgi:hypothetical protein